MEQPDFRQEELSLSHYNYTRHEFQILESVALRAGRIDARPVPKIIWNL